jgi:hypothetical protein
VTVLGTWPDRLVHAAHVVLLLLVLRMFQRKRPWDDFLLLVGAGVALALASFGAESGVFVPLLLLGTVAAAGGAARLLVVGTPSHRRIAGVQPLRGRGWFGSAVLAARLLILLLVAGLALFVLIPRPEVEEEEDDSVRPAALHGPRADGTDEEAGVSTRTGFRDEVTLGDIGRIKRDMRIAFLARVYRSRRPYRLAPSEAYWRGVALTTYDGRSWRGPRRSVRHERTDEAVRGDFLELERPPLAASVVEMEQEIALVPMASSQVLFSLWRPWLVDPGEDDAVLRRPGATLARTTPLDGPFGYTVVSLVPRPGVADPWRETLTAAERLAWTRVPTGHGRLRQLAASVAGPATGKAAASALADHLRSRCRYTLDLPALDRERPLDDFLFRAREGHCELFATALALMLRSRGIPARLVTGFRGAEYSEERRLHTVRFSNAHAWVEAHFPARGWVVLDPTPSDAEALAPDRPAAAEATDAAGTEEKAEEDPWVDRVLRFDRDDQRHIVDSAREAFRWVGEGASSLGSTTALVIGVVLAAGTFFLLTARRRERRRGERGRARPAPAGPGGDAVRRAYLAMVDALGRRGVRRERSETPRELARRAARQLPPTAGPVRRLTGLHQASCYGGRPAEKEDARRAVAALADVKAALRADEDGQPATG